MQVLWGVFTFVKDHSLTFNRKQLIKQKHAKFHKKDLVTLTFDIGNDRLYWVPRGTFTFVFDYISYIGKHYYKAKLYKKITNMAIWSWSLISILTLIMWGHIRNVCFGEIFPFVKNGKTMTKDTKIVIYMTKTPWHWY